MAADATESTLTDYYERMAAEFRSKGFGNHIGFGRTPALLAVDFSRAFTDPESPLGGDFTSAMESTNRVVAAGRLIDMPVIYSVVRFEANGRDAGPWFEKVPSNTMNSDGTPWVQLDAMLAHDPDRDIVMAKKYPSVFFGTDLSSVLRNRQVDTLIVCGITTSGCVRATVVDACSLGFRTMVVREACADRARVPHVASLFDMEMKYADVVSEAETVKYLSMLGSVAAA